MSAPTFVMPNDLSDLCRVCLQLPEESQYLDLTTIYDEEDNLTYGECFTVCTHIDLSAGEGVPHHLCKSCGLELQMTYDFYKKIEESKKVIEQCRRQIEEQQKENTQHLLAGQPNNPDTHIIDGSRGMEQLINAKYELSDDDVLPGTSQDMEHNVRVMDQENEENFAVLPNENAEEVSAELDIISKICEEHGVAPDKDDNRTIEEVGENYAATEHVEDNLEIEDYQNLEALDEEEIDEIDEEIITETTITRGIGSGIRLPLPGGPPYICEFCGHNSKSKALLASHRHRKHRFLAYQCDKCEKQFNSETLYEKHIKRLNCQKYPEFTCEYCSKKITGSANYKIHLRFHQKIYPFECEMCKKGFMMAVHLKEHIETKHENKRYICEESDCGKLFQSRSSLKSHMYVHLGSMPFRCEYCEKMLPNRGGLRWHIKTAHDFEVSREDMDRMLVTQEISIKAKAKPIVFKK